MSYFLFVTTIIHSISDCMVFVTRTLNALHLTADSDYTPGPYNVSFTSGQASATLFVSTTNDGTVQPSQYFKVMISSVDKPNIVGIGTPNTSFITIEDNPGI